MNPCFLMHIDGGWRAADSGQERDVINPALGQPFAKVAWGGREEARQAIAAAGSGFGRWSRVPLWERADLCERMADHIESHLEVLADILCQELGKPRHGEAMDEARWVPRHFRLAAQQARYLEGATIPVQDACKRVLTLRQPRGVVAVVTPWNFPAAIPSEYLPHAIVMGNTVVWTPAPTAAATASVLMRLLVEAGLPRGVINLVIGPGDVVGDELVSNEGTHAVGMTGSPKTGRIISQRCGLKPRLMELGGNGPTIVLADADPAEAARAIAPTCFYAAGQICVSAERIFVAEKLKIELVEHLVERSGDWIIGDPTNPSVTMGPQNSPAVLEKAKRHVEDAVRRGAKVVVGGQSPDRPGYFFEPTVLVDFTLDSLINQEETFGPVAPIASFREEQEAFGMAESCPLGLTAAVFTRDVDKAWRFAERLRTGIVVVNDGSCYWEAHLPFGGMSGRDSGVGRIGGRSTLEFMSEIKTIAFNVGGRP